MEAKPICVVKVDDNKDSGLESLWHIQRVIEDKLPGYYVLVVPVRRSLMDSDYEPIKIEVFYEKDFTENKFNELKDLVLKSIEQYKKHDQ